MGLGGSCHRLIRRGLLVNHYEAHADRDAVIRVLHMLLTPDEAKKVLRGVLPQ